MLTTRLVIRVLDTERTLLGWAEVMAEARGDGGLRVRQDVLVHIEATGIAHTVSVHWPDVHVEARHAAGDVPVAPGQVFQLPWRDQTVLVVGPTPGPLPAVTVRASVQIGMPVGRVGATG